jgi:hypothetical protein
MTSSIPSAAVEAGAIRLAWEYHGETPQADWPPSLTEQGRNFWRFYAESAIEAALPHLTEEPVAWRHRWAEDHVWHYSLGPRLLK